MRGNRGAKIFCVKNSRLSKKLIPMIMTFAFAGLFVGVVGSWTSIRKFMDV